eukprot:Skav222939  [mRNA]  locus=scaffold1489:494300:502640:- [translate_table: standard]
MYSAGYFLQKRLESIEEALESSYELCFNAACALIDEGRLQEAEAGPVPLDPWHEAEDAAEADASLLEAAIAHREKKGKACEEVLQSYLASHPDDAQVLAKLPLSSRTQPTTVEAIVSLHNRRVRVSLHLPQLRFGPVRQKNPEKAVACLREAIQYWSKNDEETDTLGQAMPCGVHGDHAMTTKWLRGAADSWQTQHRPRAADELSTAALEMCSAKEMSLPAAAGLSRIQLSGL